MGTKKLYRTRIIKNTARVGLNEAEFIEAIKRDKPSEIYCGLWSTKKPLFVIVRYFKYGVRYYCNSRGDQKPTWIPYKGLYSMCRNGMSQSYYKLPTKPRPKPERAGANSTQEQ